MAKLAKILQFDVNSFDAIVADNNYNVFQNAKKRWIQTPLNDLRSIHDRIQNYLSKIRTPEYLHSKKGSSYITNATKHSADLPFIKTDVSKFYPSTSFSIVFNLFNKIFECPPDVAWHLARLCCYQGKSLPTGSPISGSVAFLAHQPMFDEIAALSKTNDCVFTLFVDDLGISGFAASKSLLYRIRGIIRSKGLATANKKSKSIGLGRPKKITGVLMTIDGPKVPNRRRLKIYELKKEIQELPVNKKRKKLEKSLRGSEQEVAEIEKAGELYSKNKLFT